MAHELDMSNGRANMMYAGDRPWHGLGKYVGDQPVTAEEAIVAAGMDWDVNLREMYTYPTDTSLAVQVPDRFAVTRSDTHDVLGTVGKVFTPLQNREAFKFMDEVAGPERLVRYHTAGSLFGGEQVWLLAELTNLVADIVPNDPLRPYMCLINGHTGKMNLQVFPTAVRVVCNNTKTMAIGAAKEDKDTSPYVKIRHSRKIHDKVEEARRVLGFAVERVELFTGCMRHLARKPITSAQWNDMLDLLVRGRYRYGHPRRARHGLGCVQCNHAVHDTRLRCACRQQGCVRLPATQERATARLLVVRRRCGHEQAWLEATT